MKENYILLKNLPDARVGATIYCDDKTVGSLGYYYHSFYVDMEKPNGDHHYLAKTIVENTPEWFYKESEYKKLQTEKWRQEFCESHPHMHIHHPITGLCECGHKAQVTYTPNNTTMEKEIIGYRCPFDMLKGKIMKDDLYMQDHLNTEWFVCQGTAYNMPAELVKTWQPVYKEEEKITIGWYEVNISENKNGTIIDRLFLSREFWQSAYYTSQVMDFVFKYAGQDFILKSEYIKTILSKLK